MTVVRVTFYDPGELLGTSLCDDSIFTTLRIPSGSVDRPLSLATCFDSIHVIHLHICHLLSLRFLPEPSTKVISH